MSRRKTGQRVVGPWVQKQESADLVALAELMQAGKLAPVVEQEYDLAGVPEALRKHGQAHAHGKRVIRI